jgi:hypothetical protein
MAKVSIQLSIKSYLTVSSPGWCGTAKTARLARLYFTDILGFMLH